MIIKGNNKVFNPSLLETIILPPFNEGKLFFFFNRKCLLVLEQYHDRQLLFCEHQEIIHLIDLSKNNLKCGEISPHRLPDNSKWKKICYFTMGRSAF